MASTPGWASYVYICIDLFNIWYVCIDSYNRLDKYNVYLANMCGLYGMNGIIYFQIILGLRPSRFI